MFFINFHVYSLVLVGL